MSLDNTTVDQEAEPYPGLRFYGDKDAMFFAGRERDIKECANLLVETRVLVLHGRTGCGKSSFLRAGVKPRVSTLQLGLNFSEGFVVIRSTADPLRELVKCVLRMTRDLLETRKSDFGPLDDFAEPDELREELAATGLGDLSGAGFDAAVEQYVEDGPAFVDMLVMIADNMKSAPIFVVDQGEEVFTMAQEGAENEPAGARTNLDIGRNDAAVEFFRFLHRFAAVSTRGRIIVSLRTEYKGLFDDRIIENGPEQSRRHPGSSFAGYFLKELEKGELEQAILRPTLKATDEAWIKILDAYKNKKDVPAAPYEKFKFTIDKEVVDRLTKDLLEADIPHGGVLPAMQVACLRLWRQARFAQRVSDAPMRVRMVNLRRLGKISDQVEDYMLETVEDVCNVPMFRGRISEVTKGWLRALVMHMVHVEADGRAVTRAVTRRALIASLASQIKPANPDAGPDSEEVRALQAEFNNMIDELLMPDRNILKVDSNGGLITLGHDSLALALHRWSDRNPADAMSMMMRMGMGAVKQADELAMGDLFLKEDTPHNVRIHVPRDYVWDRHLPHFAHKHALAERLGIELVINDPATDALKRGKGGPDDWPQLKDRILKLDEGFGKAKRYNDSNNRVLVAANWGSFPGTPEQNAEGKDPRESFAPRFCDILVSNISVGNQLIGPPDEEIESLRANIKEENREEERRLLIIKLIRRSLQKLREMNAEVSTLDGSGREFLTLAAKQGWDSKDLKNSQANLDFTTGDSVKVLPAGKYQPSDPLVTILLREDMKKGKGKSRPKFIVGNPYAYAMAHQCGYVPYFGTKFLSDLAKMEMERRKTADFEYRESLMKDEDLSERRMREKIRQFSRTHLEVMPIGDITQELQKVVSHSLWQLGIEPTKWSQGLNRAMVLRVAALGYFTAEFARTNMEKLISYIHEFTGEVMDLEGDGTDKTDTIKVGRLTPRAIKDAVSECFYFLRFDDYGPEVYDLDARMAYWSDHGALNTKSVAGEIYNELVRLRQKTVESFGLTSQAIAWMRVSNDYDPASPRVSKAFRLKELAWNNFRIFNFYDAERYMSQSAALLQEEMEEKFRKT